MLLGGENSGGLGAISVGDEGVVDHTELRKASNGEADQDCDGGEVTFDELLSAI
jgi:hypothetical protein